MLLVRGRLPLWPHGGCIRERAEYSCSYSPATKFLQNIPVRGILLLDICSSWLVLSKYIPQTYITNDSAFIISSVDLWHKIIITLMINNKFTNTIYTLQVMIGDIWHMWSHYYLIKFCHFTIREKKFFLETTRLYSSCYLLGSWLQFNLFLLFNFNSNGCVLTFDYC